VGGLHNHHDMAPRRSAPRIPGSYPPGAYVARWRPRQRAGD
jgi:hypothetical protein